MAENLQHIFAQVLRQMRAERGLSQEELAFDSGYHRTYIGLLERGLRTPSITTVFKLAAALHIRPSELIRQTENQSEAAIDK